MRRVLILVTALTAIAVGVAGYLWARQDEPPGAGQGAPPPGIAAPLPSGPAEAVPSGERGGATPTPAAPGADESEPGYDRAGAPSPAARATWGQEERAAAASAAEDLVDAYLDSDTRWWDRLSVLLTPSARAVYDTVPPEALPAVSRTGSAEVSPTASALLAVATVPTGAGPYEVTLVRADGASPWLADKIVPVDS